MSSLRKRLQQELDRLKPASILIVEPDATIAELLREHLSQYDIHVVHNGRDTLAYCQETPPNLVLLDTNLPDIDAFDLLQQLLPIKFVQRMLIFFLAQQGDTHAIHMKALEMGVDDYISKPFDIIELQFRVKNALPNPAQATDLVTGLPGWPTIHQKLKKRLSQTNWTLLLINISHMAAYYDLYGTIAGQRVRKQIAEMLNDIVDDVGHLNDFIGMLSENEFVVITHNNQHDHIITSFAAQFLAKCQQWYTPQEMATGRIQLPDGQRISIMQPTTAVVPAQAKPFASTLDVLEAAETERQQNHPHSQPDPISPPLKAIFATS